jgi:hypothetical protein
MYTLTGCSSNNDFLKISSNELSIADECRNSNRNFEMDCYDLISYKNSFALLRLALNDRQKGNVMEAIRKLELVQKKGNFYANAPLAEIYKSGYGIAKNDDKAIDLLEDVEDVDPIAAYKLYFYYMDKTKTKAAIELLNFAAKNNVKPAQKELSELYLNGEYIERDIDKSDYWLEQFQDTSTSFTKKIYGI